MRIAFLTVSAEMGGSERCLVDLLLGLRRLYPGWTLDVVLPREGPLAGHVRHAGAHAVILPMPPGLARLGESAGGGVAARGAALLGAAGAVTMYTRQLRALLRELGADVIHSNGFKLHVLAARARPRGTPLVWHIHEYVTPRRLTRTLLRQSAGRAVAAVANSHSVARDLFEAVGPGLPVTTIYNGIDLEEFSPAGDVADLDALSGCAPAAPGTVRIGLVATFGRWKGHDVFLRALAATFAKATAAKPTIPVRGYIIGGAVYDTGGSQYSLDELRRMVDELGLTGRVVFTGFVDRTAPVLRALDVVVHASTLPEPFGLVIAEGMACGRAVVVSAAGGAAEIVGAGRDALTYPPGDAGALAAALARLAGDPSLRRTLGTAARASAVARFDALAFARAFGGLYTSVAGARPGAGTGT
jgi:glycosyltransferase involved in cell wall biosynthesis